MKAFSWRLCPDAPKPFMKAVPTCWFSTGSTRNGVAESPRFSRAERRMVWLLGFVAALRVGFYAATFPFFNNVDEFAHYDHVVRWSQGEFPRRMGWPTPTAVAEYALIASPEYTGDTTTVPPMRMLPDERDAAIVVRKHAAGAAMNHELLQPPLYYILAGAWRAGGQKLGLPPTGLAYSVRALNVLLVFLTVLVAAAIGRQVFPEDRFNRLALPALVALMPQDAFYSITNDVPSALLGGSVMVLGLSLHRSNGSNRRALWAGAFAAAALMAKWSNIIVMIPVVGAAIMVLSHARREGQGRHALYTTITLGLATFIPLLAWMTFNLLTMDDLSGGATTAAFKGWTPIPLTARLDHPLFTSPARWRTFLQDVIVTLWRGEYIWHGIRLASPTMDWLYILATITGLTGALLAAIRRVSSLPAPSACALIWSWLMLCAGVAFLVYISVSWDFGPFWFYPSRNDPVLSSGRLILASLIPFCLLLVVGLDEWVRLLGRPWLRAPILLALLMSTALSEFILHWPVLASPYNAFHLLGR